MRMPELKSLAREHRLRGYSRMRKAELVPLLPRRIRIVSHNVSDKVILPRLFQIWRHFQVAPV